MGNAAGYWFLWVRCPACRTINAIDLRALDHDAAVPAPEGTPEEIFHREWQRQMLALAVEDLRNFCDQTGRAVRYELFAAYDLAEEPRPSYDELASAHGLPVTSVTNHLAWARRELRRLLEARLGPRELRSVLCPR